MRRFIWQFLIVYSLSITAVYSRHTLGYLYTEELQRLSLHLNELSDLLADLPDSRLLPVDLIENALLQLNLIETLVSQAESIYNNHSLMLLNECEMSLSPVGFSLAHREQPLIILNIRRLIRTVRAALISLQNTIVIDMN